MEIISESPNPERVDRRGLQDSSPLQVLILVSANDASKREFPAQSIRLLVKARNEVLPILQRSETTWEGAYRSRNVPRCALKIIIKPVLARRMGVIDQRLFLKPS